jgi:hypothetical protein
VALTNALGARARAGSLSAPEQAAVAGLDVVLGGAAILAGFSDFGWETLVLLVPVSLDGACPADRVRRYGLREAPPLRSWASDLPLRSERFRAPVRRWAASLLEAAPEGTERRLGPVGPFTWPGADYIAADEANRVPVALNTPTTTLEGVAVREGGRWRLDLVVHAYIAYPEKATLQAGPIVLEEGMFADADLFLHPYCAEYTFSRWADDADLQRREPIRGPFERASTALLRAMGAGYR